MSKRILIVDDDLYIRELYQGILTKQGYNVEVAEDGLDGLTKLKEGGYDLVLLDVMMPKLDGVAVLAALYQEKPLHPNGPILLLTNFGHNEVIKEAIAKGATSYLIKSDLTPDQLTQNLKKYLDTTPTL
jgi:CheY-like chemotaxis protein